ncbi:hypothetical protein AB0H34_03070 [Saccharopolyspora shandongensis]|uniref:hypothetical protein n=1 Tax=Saccharopolyspora shandongensis TaxID=418495 RepID=UPI0033DB23A2
MCPPAKHEELACAMYLGVWAQRRRGLAMSPLHREGAELAMSRRRLALVAPREHGKSETLSVNATAWRCIYQPGDFELPGRGVDCAGAGNGSAAPSPT